MTYRFQVAPIIRVGIHIPHELGSNQAVNCTCLRTGVREELPRRSTARNVPLQDRCLGFDALRNATSARTATRGGPSPRFTALVEIIRNRDDLAPQFADSSESSAFSTPEKTPA